MYKYKGRILGAARASCQICNTGEVDNLQHALATCRGSKPVFDWMMIGLRKFVSNLTIEKVLLLDIVPDNPIPFDELPLIWFISTVLANVWDARAARKSGNLNHIAAKVIADCNIVKKSKFKDIALTIET